MGTRKMRMPSTKYYPFIDGLRALSIVWVMAHHVNLFFDMQGMLGSLYPYLKNFMLIGFLGVDIFFVISGFLITGLLVEPNFRPPDIPRFYVHRFFKIIPSYLAVIFVTFLTFSGPDFFSGFSGLVNYVLMMQNYFGIYEPLGHLWSIAVEEHFYVVYPLVIFVVWKLSARKPERFCLNLALMLVLLMLGGIWIRFLIFSQLSVLGSPWPWQKSHVRFDALLMGGFVWCVAQLLPADSRLRRTISWISLLTVVVFFLSLGSMRAYSLQSLEYTKAYLMAGFLMGACLLHNRLFITRFLSLQLLRYIGKNSYGIYLWHYPIIFFLSRFLGFRMNRWEVLAFYLILTFAIGILSTITIERYFLSFRKKMYATSNITLKERVT